MNKHKYITDRESAEVNLFSVRIDNNLEFDLHAS